MRDLEEINKEIKTLKDTLDTVQGSKTEVYTRIVGYYRSIKNWNKGKREEYNHRIPFSIPGEVKATQKPEKGGILSLPKEKMAV